MAVNVFDNHQFIRDSTSEFLELVTILIKKKQSFATRNALSVWAYKYPAWYRRFLSSQTGLSLITARQLMISDMILWKSVQNFIKTLPQSSLFILNDTKHFFSEKQRNVYKILLSRKTLGSERLYFLIFRAINQSALNARNWNEFRINYKQIYAGLLKQEQVLSAVSKRLGKEIYSQIKGQKSIVFIDTGLQATMAMFLAESLYLFDKRIKTDIRLFCAYPWLKDIFLGRYFSTDARLLFTLERGTDLSQNKA